MPSFRVEMYYVYSYLREDYSPYYIGKGTGNRYKKKKSFEIKPPKDNTRIKIIKAGLTEEDAFALEKLYILMFGRKDLGTGILRNKTDGGEGCSGFITSEETKEKLRQLNLGKITPEHIKEKISNSLKNRIISEEHKQKLRKPKQPRTEEHKNNLSKSLKGRKSWNKGKKFGPKPEDQKKKISDTMKKYRKENPQNGIRQPKLLKTRYFISPSGDRIKVDDLPQFCLDNNLRVGNMRQVWNETRKTHLGWKKDHQTINR